MQKANLARLALALTVSIMSVALARAQQSAAPPTWAGWARCQISVTGPGYSDQQTHTWTITGGAPKVEGAFLVYPGTWSVVGGGSLQRTQGTQTLMAQWATNAPNLSAPIAVFVRASDNRMFIQARHAQVRGAAAVQGYQQLIIDGKPQTPGKIAAEAFEWSFPEVVVSRPNPNASLIANGSSTPVVNGSVGLMQPAGSRVTASCTWQFSEGYVPAPPPTLTAQAIPTPQVTGGGTGAAIPAPLGGPSSLGSTQLAPAAPTTSTTLVPAPLAPTTTTLSPAAPTTSTAQAFTSSGTFTVPTGVTQLVVQVWGAGGGGATGGPGTCGPNFVCAGGTGGHGGGSGAYTRVVFTVTGGTTLDVVIGSGGAAGADGAATQVKQGSNVVAMGEGGKGGGAGGAAWQAAGVQVASPGVDGSPGRVATGTGGPGEAGGAGGTAVPGSVIPIGTTGGAGGQGQGSLCHYYVTPSAAQSGWRCASAGPGSPGSAGLRGYALIAW